MEDIEEIDEIDQIKVETESESDDENDNAVCEDCGQFQLNIFLHWY